MSATHLKFNVFVPNCVKTLPGDLYIKSQRDLFFSKVFIHIYQFLNDKILNKSLRLDQIEFDKKTNNDNSLYFTPILFC